MRCLGQKRGRVLSLIFLTKTTFRSCPRRCHWRSFAVLRRISLAARAQRLRQSQDDKLPVEAIFYNLSG
jgi:hypothetical protein